MNKTLELYEGNKFLLYYDVANSLWNICKMANAENLTIFIRPNKLNSLLDLPQQEDGKTEWILFFKIYDREDDFIKCISFVTVCLNKDVNYSIPEEIIFSLDNENEQLFGRVLVALMRDMGTEVIDIQNDYVTADDLEDIAENKFVQAISEEDR